jgi:hypothetical protein
VTFARQQGRVVLRKGAQGLDHEVDVARGDLLAFLDGCESATRMGIVGARQLHVVAPGAVRVRDAGGEHQTERPQDMVLGQVRAQCETALGVHLLVSPRAEGGEEAPAVRDERPHLRVLRGIVAESAGRDENIERLGVTDQRPGRDLVPAFLQSVLESVVAPKQADAQRRRLAAPEPEHGVGEQPRRAALGLAENRPGEVAVVGERRGPTLAVHRRRHDRDRRLRLPSRQHHERVVAVDGECARGAGSLDALHAGQELRAVGLDIDTETGDPDQREEQCGESHGPEDTAQKRRAP